MIIVKTFISKDKPAVANGLWLKPVDGGFVAYLLSGSSVKPLKIIDEDNTQEEEENKPADLIGSVRDKKSANTINGAKAYAKDIKNAIIGKPEDDSSELTLNGLKALIEERTKNKKNYASKSKQEG